MPTSRAMRVTSDGERRQRVDHRVDGVLQRAAISPRDLDGDLLASRSPLATAVVTSAMSRTWSVRLRRHLVDVVGQLLPDARHVLHVGLHAERAFGADQAGDAGHLGGEPVELVDRGVDRVLEREDLAARVDARSCCDRSPSAMAVTTSAMLRTWTVRLSAMS